MCRDIFGVTESVSSLKVIKRSDYRFTVIVVGGASLLYHWIVCAGHSTGSHMTSHASIVLTFSISSLIFCLLIFFLVVYYFGLYFRLLLLNFVLKLCFFCLPFSLTVTVSHKNSFAGSSMTFSGGELSEWTEF